MSMSPEELQHLIAGYVLYTLSPEEAAVLEQLMRTDPAISHEIERMQQALESTFMLSEVQPPERLRSQILTLAHQEMQQQSEAWVSSPTVAETPVSISAPRPSQRRRWGIGLGVIVASLIAGLSISNYVLWRSLKLAQSQPQPPPSSEVLTVSLEPATTDSPAEVTILLDPANLQATLDAANLPPLPDGQVYVLWTVLEADAPFTTDAKNAILTETFTVDEQGTQSEQILLPPVYRDRRWVKAIAITVEAAEAPQRHDASPILIQAL